MIDPAKGTLHRIEDDLADKHGDTLRQWITDGLNAIDRRLAAEYIMDSFDQVPDDGLI